MRDTGEILRDTILGSVTERVYSRVVLAMKVKALLSFKADHNVCSIVMARVVMRVEVVEAKFRGGGGDSTMPRCNGRLPAYT